MVRSEQNRSVSALAPFPGIFDGKQSPDTLWRSVCPRKAMIAACGLFRRSAWYCNVGCAVDVPRIAPGIVIPRNMPPNETRRGHRRLAANVTGNRIRCVHATAEGYEMRAVSCIEVSGFPVNRAGYLPRSGK